MLRSSRLFCLALSLVLAAALFAVQTPLLIGEDACGGCPCDRERAAFSQEESGQNSEEEENCPPECASCDCALLRVALRTAPSLGISVPALSGAFPLLEPTHALASGVKKKPFRPPRLTS